jgi:hypothetical protein
VAKPSRISRLRRLFVGVRTKTEDKKHHESNLVWGPVGIACSIIVSVVATMVQDLRWLVIVAWSLFAFGIWRICKQIPYRGLRRWIASVSMLVVAVGLYGIAFWLKPHDAARTFPFLRPDWNQVDHAWIFTLVEKGDGIIGNTEASIIDVDRAMRYVKSVTPTPKGFDGILSPSKEYIHYFGAPRLSPSSTQMLAHFISITPLHERSAVFSARISTPERNYEEYLLMRFQGGRWRLAMRLVDLTSHLNLVSCHDEDIKDAALMPLQTDDGCDWKFTPKITPWEKWQRNPDMTGASPFGLAYVGSHPSAR